MSADPRQKADDHTSVCYALDAHEFSRVTALLRLRRMLMDQGFSSSRRFFAGRYATAFRYFCVNSSLTRALSLLDMIRRRLGVFGVGGDADWSSVPRAA